ncbi:MAG: RNA methyltransferase [Candidatus Sericytochromatia bacterium]
MNTITSKDNKLIKLVKKLHQRKERKDNNLFIIEGEKLIKEALKEKLNIKYLFLKSKSTNNFNIPQNTEIFEIPENLMEYISTTDSAPPFLAIAEIQETKINNIKKSNLILVVSELQDPGNFGTIIRTAEATGVNYIIATKGTVDLYNPKVVRSSMGSIFRQKIIYVDKILDIINDLQDFQIVMTTPYSDNNFYDIDYKDKTIIFMGNEGQGLSKELLNKYKGVKIPMMGNVESLNTSIATSIILYEVLRQRNILKGNL